MGREEGEADGILELFSLFRVFLKALPKSPPNMPRWLSCAWEDEKCMNKTEATEDKSRTWTWITGFEINSYSLASDTAAAKSSVNETLLQANGLF